MDRAVVSASVVIVRAARRLRLLALLACALIAAASLPAAPAGKRAPAAAPPPTAAAAPVAPAPARQGDHAAVLVEPVAATTSSAAARCIRWAASRGGRPRSIARAPRRTRRWCSTRGDLFLPQRGGLPRRQAARPRRDRAPRPPARVGVTGAWERPRWLPGERDLAIGLPLLRRLAKQAGIPMLAANLYGRDGKRLFDADRIVDAAGIKIGVFGVSAPPTPDDAAAFKAAGIDARDPAAAARDGGRRPARARRAARVALVHVGDGERDPQAARGRARHRLGGARAQRHEPGDAREGRRRAHAGGDDPGQTRRAAWTCTSSATSWRSPTAASAPMIETILADHRRQLTEYDQRLGDTDPAAMRDYYEQRRKEIEKAIERESALLQQLARGDHRQLVREPDHPARRGRRPTSRASRCWSTPTTRRTPGGRRPGSRSGWARTERPTRPSPPRPPPAAAAARATSAPRACGACHAPALAQWKTTKHARALSALARVGRDKDPSCVGCHVTGYLQAGGPRHRGRAQPTSPTSAASRATGPGSKHGAAADKRGTLARAVPEATCRGCHTADVTNGEFDYKKFDRHRRPGAQGPAPRPGKALAPGRRSTIVGPSWPIPPPSRSRSRCSGRPLPPLERRGTRAGRDVSAGTPPRPASRPLAPRRPRAPSPRSASRPHRSGAAPPRRRASAPAEPPPGANFETLGTGAVRTRDIGTLLSSFVDRCDDEKRDIDRARCRATTRVPAPDAAASGRSRSRPTIRRSIAVSDYDAAVKGYHVALAGCVACSKPVDDRARERAAAGHAQGPRQGRGLADEGGRRCRATPSASTAWRTPSSWLDTERPFLRAEFLFQPDAGSRVDVRRQPRRRAEAAGRARLQPLHGRRAGVEAAVDGRSADRPAPGHEDPTCAGAKSRGATEQRRRRRRPTICRRS